MNMPLTRDTFSLYMRCFRSRSNLTDSTCLALSWARPRSYFNRFKFSYLQETMTMTSDQKILQDGSGDNNHAGESGL